MNLKRKKFINSLKSIWLYNNVVQIQSQFNNENLYNSEEPTTINDVFIMGKILHVIIRLNKNLISRKQSVCF